MLTALVIAAMAVASPVPAKADSVASQPITLKTSTGDLFGSLVVPSGAGKHPVVLIIAGSGPTDRDGNSRIQVAPGKTLHPDTYKILAADLAADGIASVRYDKRGIAASAGAMAGQTEADYRFDTGINDAAAWVKMLRSDPQFSKVVVLGHSEGSLLVMVAIQREKADGFVSLEGAGRPAAVILREQLIKLLAENNRGRSTSTLKRYEAVGLFSLNCDHADKRALTVAEDHDFGELRIRPQHLDPRCSVVDPGIEAIVGLGLACHRASARRDAALVVAHRRDSVGGKVSGENFVRIGVQRLARSNLDPRIAVAIGWTGAGDDEDYGVLTRS